MNGIKLIGILLVTTAFVTALAILSVSYGVELPKSQWVYWVFLLVTLISGNLFLFAGTPLSSQSSSLFLISTLFFVVAGLCFLGILLDLFGLYSAKTTYTLWIFLFVSTMSGGILHYFGQDLRKGQDANK